MKISKYNLALLFCFSSQSTNASDYFSNFIDSFGISVYPSSIALKGLLQYDTVNLKGYAAASQKTPFKDTINSIVRCGNIGVEDTLVSRTQIIF